MKFIKLKKIIMNLSSKENDLDIVDIIDFDFDQIINSNELIYIHCY